MLTPDVTTDATRTLIVATITAPGMCIFASGSCVYNYKQRTVREANVVMSRAAEADTVLGALKRGRRQRTHNLRRRRFDVFTRPNITDASDFVDVAIDAEAVLGAIGRVEAEPPRAGVVTPQWTCNYATALVEICCAKLVRKRAELRNMEGRLVEMSRLVDNAVAHFRTARGRDIAPQTMYEYVRDNLPDFFTERNATLAARREMYVLINMINANFPRSQYADAVDDVRGRMRPVPGNVYVDMPSVPGEGIRSALSVSGPKRRRSVRASSGAGGAATAVASSASGLVSRPTRRSAVEANYRIMGLEPPPSAGGERVDEEDEDGSEDEEEDEADDEEAADGIDDMGPMRRSLRGVKLSADARSVSSDHSTDRSRGRHVRQLVPPAGSPSTGRGVGHPSSQDRPIPPSNDGDVEAAKRVAWPGERVGDSRYTVFGLRRIALLILEGAVHPFASMAPVNVIRDVFCHLYGDPVAASASGLDNFGLMCADLGAHRYASAIGRLVATTDPANRASYRGGRHPWTDVSISASLHADTVWANIGIALTFAGCERSMVDNRADDAGFSRIAEMSARLGFSRLVAYRGMDPTDFGAVSPAYLLQRLSAMDISSSTHTALFRLYEHNPSIRDGMNMLLGKGWSDLRDEKNAPQLRDDLVRVLRHLEREEKRVSAYVVALRRGLGTRFATVFARDHASVHALPDEYDKLVPERLVLAARYPDLVDDAGHAEGLAAIGSNVMNSDATWSMSLWPIKQRIVVIKQYAESNYMLYALRETRPVLRHQMRILSMGVSSPHTVLGHNYGYMLLGHAGVGKTFTADHVGQFISLTGMLTRSHQDTHVLQRADLVGGYVGQTALKTITRIRDTVEGQMFVDEAYSLADGGEEDYGREAINTIVAEATRYSGRWMPCMAGYPGDMHRLMEVNQGLASRFTIIRVDDLSPHSICAMLVFKLAGADATNMYSRVASAPADVWISLFQRVYALYTADVEFARGGFAEARLVGAMSDASLRIEQCRVDALRVIGDEDVVSRDLLTRAARGGLAHLRGELGALVYVDSPPVVGPVGIYISEISRVAKEARSQLEAEMGDTGQGTTSVSGVSRSKLFFSGQVRKLDSIVRELTSVSRRSEDGFLLDHGGVAASLPAVTLEGIRLPDAYRSMLSAPGDISAAALVPFFVGVSV